MIITLPHHIHHHTIKEETFNIHRFSSETHFSNLSKTKQTIYYRIFVISNNNNNNSNNNNNNNNSNSNSNNNNHDYSKLGWILLENVTICMRCQHLFGLFRTKHSCFTCGNVICHLCSLYQEEILELFSIEKHRICCDCYQKKQQKKSNNSKVRILLIIWLIILI
jgi:hypothetical protein